MYLLFHYSVSFSKLTSCCKVDIKSKNQKELKGNSFSLLSCPKAISKLFTAPVLKPSVRFYNLLRPFTPVFNLPQR